MSDCINWPWGVDVHGYGYLMQDGKPLKAHRVASSAYMRRIRGAKQQPVSQ